MNTFYESRIIEEYKNNEESKLNAYKKSKEDLKKRLDILSKIFQEAQVSIEESEYSSKQKSHLKSLIENFNHKK